jgi:hypothetical protein
MRKTDRARVSRRAVLRGVGGIAIGLPALDIFQERQAYAAGNGGDYAVFIVNDNGVAQAHAGNIFGSGSMEPETFWPTSAPGPITQASLGMDAGVRTLGELSAYGDRLLIVKGIAHPFKSAGCAHNGGDGQVLTAAHPIHGTTFDTCDGESIDNRIATVKNPPGREPLALSARKFPDGSTGFAYPGYISYRGPMQPRAAQASPLLAYQSIVGMASPPAGGNATTDAARRKSVNDLLRSQMQALLARTDLSSADRQRLDQHFTAIRDIEVQVSGQLPATTVAAITAASADPLAPLNHDAVIKAHLDVLVFAISSGYTKSAVFKIGDRIDRAIWTVNGTVYPEFHQISHRIFSDGASGAPIPNAAAMHHQIDIIHAQRVKYFLDQLAAINTPTGKLIDLGYTAWTNQVAVGSHDYWPVPWIIAGGANGFLKTGQYLDVGTTTGNKILNTLLNAAGVRNPDGTMIQNFGAPQTPGGVISAMIA